jgi:protocatechuate 3,4-dioxygenase beta subunit
MTTDAGIDGGRTAGGLRLARPDEDIVDQGLGFDLETLFDRRRMLRLMGVAGFGATLVACGTPSPSSSTSAAGGGSTSTVVGEACATIPEETAGPYPGDGSNGPDVLSASGIVRSDIRSSFGEFSGTAEGIPLQIALTIEDASTCAPLEGAAVYLWHCDRSGAHSLYTVTDQNYLRGVQAADAEGLVRFTSVFPACYSGRWPHIHFEVYPDISAASDDANVIATSQVAVRSRRPRAPMSTRPRAMSRA